MKSLADDEERCPTPHQIWGPGGLTEQIQAERKLDKGRLGIRRERVEPVEVIRVRFHPPRQGVSIE